MLMVLISGGITHRTRLSHAEEEIYLYNILYYHDSTKVISYASHHMDNSSLLNQRSAEDQCLT